MKKTISLILALLMLGSAAASCTKNNPEGETKMNETNAPETKVVETAVPETDAPETEEPLHDLPHYVKTLTINGTDISEYVISCNTSAGGVIPYAASELQKYI